MKSDERIEGAVHMSVPQIETLQRVSQRRLIGAQHKDDLTRDLRIAALADEINALAEWAVTENELIEMKAAAGGLN